MLDSWEDHGGHTMEFVTFNEARDAAPMLKGLPGDNCSCPHWGYVLKGKITYRFDDHDEVYTPGDAFYIPPRHIPHLRRAPSTSRSAPLKS